MVINEARPWELVHEVLPRFMEVKDRFSPGVVVLNYGGGECQPRVFPAALMRWMTNARSTPSLRPVRSRVRAMALKRVDQFMVWSMPRIAPRLGMRTWRIRPARFKAELTQLLMAIRVHTAGLVLVLTPQAPGALQERLMPGFTERAARYEQIMRDVVARIADPKIRIIEAGSVVEKLGSRKAMYDGLHYSTQGHDAVAGLLLDEIVPWLAAETGGGGHAEPSADTESSRVP